MKANEYQKMAMRTNDGKTTKRLLECMLRCDMEYLLSQNLVYEDVMQTNIDKLKARYPEGFSADRSLHRAEGDV